MRFLSLQRLFGDHRASWARGQRGKKTRRSSSRTRRLLLAPERLEDRTLLSTLPNPLTNPPVFVSNQYQAPTIPLNLSTPAIAVDPLNPNNMIAADVLHTEPSGSVEKSWMEVYSSTDGGATWSQLDFISNLTDPTTFAGTPAPFVWAESPSVAFDRLHNGYLVYAENDHATPSVSGAIVMSKYSFAGGFPISVGFTDPITTFTVPQNVLYEYWNSDSAFNPSLAIDTSVRSFTDSNGLTITDPAINPQTGQGPIYVAWDSEDTLPTNKLNDGTTSTNYAVGFNPYTIKIIASDDGGNTFSGQAYVNTGGGFFTPDPTITGAAAEHYGFVQEALPALTVSQGTPSGRANSGLVTGAYGGQLSVAYDQFSFTPRGVDPLRIADNVRFSRELNPTTNISDGAAADTFTQTFYPFAAGVGDAVLINNVTFPIATTFTQAVNINDPEFTTLSDLDVGINLVHPNLDQISITLTAPTGQQVTLFRNHANAGGSTNKGVGIGGANLNGFIDEPALDTVFDQQAGTYITDQAAKAPYTGHYKPELIFDPNSPTGFAPNLDQFTGLNKNQMNGIWTLTIVDNVSSGTPTQFLNDWSLRFTSKLTFPQVDHVVASNAARGMYAIPYRIPPMSNFTDDGTHYPLVPAPGGQPGRGVSPGISIASDNTIGAFSLYQGRLYITYVQHFTGEPAAARASDKTDIYMTFSDDGGKSWSFPTKVNDDSLFDGYSQATNTGQRPQIEPRVAVDNSTGALVITFLDARHDASAGGAGPSPARYLDTIAVSSDGGLTFNSQSLSFADFHLDVTDPITGQTTTFEGAPVNESSGNSAGIGATDPVFSFGDYQGLAVSPGEIHAIFATNQEGMMPFGLRIKTTTAFTIAGPRVDPSLSTLGGPVTAFTETDLNNNSVSYNNTRMADGEQQVNGFVVNFDRPIDPSTLTPAAITVEFRDTTTPAGSPGQILTVTQASIIPVIDNSQPLVADPRTGQLFTSRAAQQAYFGASRYLIKFQTPTGASNGIGTYSYSISAPFIHDRIRNPINPTTTTGALMDQNVNGVGGENPEDDFSIPSPDAALGNTTPLQLPYDKNTLPLIVPGPHVIGSFVPIATNTVTADNLVLNNTVTSIDVVFDRDMDVTSFEGDGRDILRVMGPAGQITGPFAVSTDPTNAQNPFGPDPAGQHRTFRISFPPQFLSGTYLVTFGPNIKSVHGDLMDQSLNAGLYVLRGVDPTSSSTSPVSVDWTKVPNTLSPGTTYSAPLTFTDLFAIQDITVTLNVTFPNDPDLQGYLIGPNGTKIQLFNKVGSSGTRANFVNTVFSDRATQSIQFGSPPFNGSFNPLQSLDNAFQNTASAGTWTLQIVNTSNSNTGTLNGWRLTLFKTLTGTGLGEVVGDQDTVSFRIFTTDPTNPLSQSEWTAVGPASENSNGNSARTGGLAMDPSDPTGNTVYVGGSSGGIWRTSNFLTTDPRGPTYVPLTDFGPAYSLNIGGLAVFGRNNDVSQSIVIVGTGEGDALGSNMGFSPYNTSIGVGFLRSTDAGADWQLLDSRTNVDSAGNLLPINDPRRDHIFVGTSVYKVLVDPKPSPSGQVIIYAALRGRLVNNVVDVSSGGIWKSVDSGNHWTQVFAGNGALSGDATDVIFGPGDVDSVTGNIRRLYAGFRGQGVYTNDSAGVGFWQLLSGNAQNPLIRAGDVGGTPFDTVQQSPLPPAPSAQSNNPTGAKGRIALAAPAPTGNPIQDLLYSGWIYAVVGTGSGNTQVGENVGGGDLDGLYMSKDFGQNWTRVRVPRFQPPGSNLQVPTNDETQPDFDVVQSQATYDVSIVVDPTNPRIVYVGGTADGNVNSALIRVDTTHIFDPFAFIGHDFDENNGGAMAGGDQVATSGSFTFRDPVNVKNPDGSIKYDIFLFDQASGGFFLPAGNTPFINLIKDPYNVFSNATFYTYDEAPGLGFTNEGTESTWTEYDVNNGVPGTDYHRMYAFVDPTTGRGRIVAGNDQGVVTWVDDGSGTAMTSIGTAPVVFGARNGNLQIAQFYYGAAQPSNIAAQAAQALFYGMAQDDGAPASDPNVLTNGNLGWTGIEGDGTGVATDQSGTGTVYQFHWPCCVNIFGSNTTDFFQVHGPGTVNNRDVSNSRTSGLFVLPNSGPGPNSVEWPLAPGSNIAVNPVASEQDINGNFANLQQIFMSDQAGNIYRTVNSGLHWDLIATPALSGMDGTYGRAPAWGAPDPADPSGSTADFMYVGTEGGHIYVTFNGGGQWFNISAGLDGQSVQAIVTNPIRGSHEAYAVTLQGVFHIVDSKAAGARWENITGNIMQVPSTSFGDVTQPIPLFGQYTSTGATTTTYLTALAADWRYAIPDDPSNPTGPTHPMLYVGGAGGVVRSTDKGSTWAVFPVGGGQFPHANVTDLDLVAGTINPTTGRPNSDPSNPGGYLLATTFGRGSFVIRLPLVHGPRVVGMTASSGTPPVNFVTVTFDHQVDPNSFTTADATVTDPNNNPVAVSSILDLTSAHLQFQINFAQPQNTQGTYTVLVGPNISDFGGNLMDQNNNGVLGENAIDPAGDIFQGHFNVSLVSGPKVINLVGPASVPGSSLTITFMTFDGKGINPSTFTLSSINSFRGPNGSISATSVTPVAGSGNLSFRISFPATSTTGTYAINIGPNIADADGNLMNQNGNTVNGELPSQGNPGDTFTGTFTIGAGPRLQSIVPSSASPPIDHVTVNFDKPMNAATLTPSSITLTRPGGAAVPVTIQQVTNSSYRVNFAPQTVLGTYRITIGPSAQDTAGNPMDQNNNTGTFQLVPPIGPQVVSVTPTPPNSGTTVVVTFNEAVDPASFTPGSVTITGAGGPVPVTSVTQLSPTSFQVTFAPQPQGTYTITITGVRDTNGNPPSQTQSTTFTLNPGVGPSGDQLILTGADAGGGPNVILFDKTTGQIPFNFFAFDMNFTGGVRVALGDVNGDGTPDMITAAGPGGGTEVRVFDGVTGGLIRDFFPYGPLFTGGAYLASADINGDGFAEIIIGADAGGGPDVKVISGKDGSTLFSFFAYDMNFTGGVRVAAGDVNADGVPDIICGAGPGGGPNVTVISGKDRSPLQSFFAFDMRFTPGIYVSASDVTGDGHADILVGAGPGGGPNVAVFSGLDDSPITSFFAYDPRFTGGVRVAGFQAQGNNLGRLITVAGPGGGTDVHIYDVLSDSIVDQFFAYDPRFTGGIFLAAAP